MQEYRRQRVPGGTYFFTVALEDRRSDLLVHEIAALRAAVVRTRMLHPFDIDAWVVLPEPMRAVWTLPEGDAAYSLRWTLIKRWFSAAIPAGESRSASRVAKGARGIWQRRFWEHTVRDAADFARPVDYVQFNPVKHGLVARAIDWPHSSFRTLLGGGGMRRLEAACSQCRSKPSPGCICGVPRTTAWMPSSPLRASPPPSINTIRVKVNVFIRFPNP